MQATITGADDTSRVRETAARALAIIALVIIVALLGATYFGHAKGIYGVCYGSSGRSIPCAVAGDGNHRSDSTR